MAVGGAAQAQALVDLVGPPDADDSIWLLYVLILVDAVSNSIERVKEGKQLGPSLGDCRTLFSGSTLEMISVAEESGKLDAELVRIANVTEADLDRQLKTAVALAEPLMLFLIAGFIGTIFIGMVIPIFSLQDHIK